MDDILSERLRAVISRRQSVWGISAFKEGWVTYIRGDDIPHYFFRFCTRSQGVFREGYIAAHDTCTTEGVIVKRYVTDLSLIARLIRSGHKVWRPVVRPDPCPFHCSPQRIKGKHQETLLIPYNIVPELEAQNIKRVIIGNEERLLFCR